jgi:hypothetical protein
MCPLEPRDEGGLERPQVARRAHHREQRVDPAADPVEAGTPHGGGSVVVVELLVVTVELELVVELVVAVELEGLVDLLVEVVV